MIGAALAIAALIVMTPSAGAQTVVVVNGDPVTQFDVDQRAKLIQISTHKTPTRNEVIEELINEKLKIQLLKRFRSTASTRMSTTAYVNMARRMRATPKDFTENLEKQGLKTETLKSRIRADLIWGQIIRGRLPEQLPVQRPGCRRETCDQKPR